MNLPIQSEPVCRVLTTQSAFIDHAGAASGEGILPSEYGVEASGWFDDVLGGIQKVGQVATTLGPALGAFGI